MNDEPSSSSAPPPPDTYTTIENDVEERTLPTADEVAERQKKNRHKFNKKRGELLDDLLRTLDILIYAELSTVYYMDCAFIRFAIRAFVQFVFMTPKPAMFPEPPSNRPYVGAIFGTNILCIILHIIYSAPLAGEATRGYLHGGLAMDFIGQKGPSSKTHLILLDLLVLFLQIVHMSAHLLRQRIKDGLVAAAAARSTTPAATGASSGQTVEDEEQGVRRSTEQARGEEIEMQNLNPSGAAAEVDTEVSEPPDQDTSERDALLAQPRRTDAHIFDAFNSGQIMVADLDLFKSVKEQFMTLQKEVPDNDQADRNRLMRQRLIARALQWRGGLR